MLVNGGRNRIFEVSPGLLMMGIVHTLGGFLASNGAIETSCVAVRSSGGMVRCLVWIGCFPWPCLNQRCQFAEDATPAGPKRAVAVGRFLTVTCHPMVVEKPQGRFALIWEYDLRLLVLHWCLDLSWEAFCWKTLVGVLPLPFLRCWALLHCWRLWPLFQCLGCAGHR